MSLLVQNGFKWCFKESLVISKFIMNISVHAEKKSLQVCNDFKVNYQSVKWHWKWFQMVSLWIDSAFSMYDNYSMSVQIIMGCADTNLW